jgi:23S rRNA (pseudouridine1915-N3)-methyltransferase
MKVSIVCVGRPRGGLAAVIADYEKRAGRYFRFETTEVKESPYRGQPVAQLLANEGDRLLAHVPGQNQLVALHRPGASWSSESLAAYLANASLGGIPGVSFMVGGAFGLSPAVLERADHHLSLSGMTLPHEVARLVLTEQIYRAGTITRGEPYHKAAAT